jgi:transcriptional regulator with XRE-family HTH domain
MARRAGHPLDPGHAQRRQIIAGRRLIGFTQKQLAAVAEVGESTVANYERGARHTDYFVIQRMKYALDRLGVAFIKGGDGSFGVLLKPAFRPGAAEKMRGGFPRPKCLWLTELRVETHGIEPSTSWLQTRRSRVHFGLPLTDGWAANGSSGQGCLG